MTLESDRDDHAHCFETVIIERKREATFYLLHKAIRGRTRRHIVDIYVVKK